MGFVKVIVRSIHGLTIERIGYQKNIQFLLIQSLMRILTMKI